MAPFIIYALGRSRTAWLSRFLTYGDWRCCHDMATYMRSLAQVEAFFRLPHIGTAETAAMYGHQLVRHLVPGIREVVIRRPVEDVIRSATAALVGSGFEYPPEARRTFEAGARCLDKIAASTTGLVLDYADLEHEWACQAIFDWCLVQPFDRDWWLQWKDENAQVDMPSVIRYRKAHEPEITAFKRECKSELRRLARAGDL